MATTSTRCGATSARARGFERRARVERRGDGAAARARGAGRGDGDGRRGLASNANGDANGDARGAGAR